MAKSKQSVQLNQLQRLIDDVDRVAQERGAPPPGEFLAQVMTGQDPRPMDAPLFALVKKISFREFTGGEAYPTPEEWDIITQVVLGSGDYQKTPVPIEHSLKAAEKLMEYLHAKMKRVEIEGDMSVKLEVKPLTGDDLEAFKDKFDNEF